MRKFSLSSSAMPPQGGLLERIEIIRASLRWSTQLDRPQIEALLRQVTELRDEAMNLSRQERLLQAGGEALEPLDILATAPSPKQTMAQRRQALIDGHFVFDGVFGDNPGLLEALEVGRRVAPTDLPVLIEGESGTGKELFAKVIHANGQRAGGPFVTVNCGAIPENLIESELFGHKKGAFTGAASDRKGKFESANGGTLFLDEVGELPLPGQVKLLRVLQSQEIQRVGSDEPVRVDTRIVAATNRDLCEMCADGRFREDLYYRLSLIQVRMPPLRERRDEIPILIRFLSSEAAQALKRRPIRLSASLQAFLLAYDYPGNIRELRNILYRLSALADEVAGVEHLAPAMRPAASGGASGDATTQDLEGLPLAEVKKRAADAAERLFLENALRATGGRVTWLAERTGLNRTYIQNLLKKHGLSSKAFRAARGS